MGALEMNGLPEYITSIVDDFSVTDKSEDVEKFASRHNGTYLIILTDEIIEALRQGKTAVCNVASQERAVVLVYKS